MAPSFDFRRAKSEDAGQISKLIGSTWAKFFAYSVTESDLDTYLNTTVCEAQILREINSKSNIFLVAYTNTRTRPVGSDEQDSPSAETEEIIGVTQLNLDTLNFSLTTEYPIELHRLYINPDHQGSGLAAALMEYTQQTCREMGKRGLWLGVWEDNARGIRFYEKMGFEQRSEHSFWVGQSERRDWIMEKAL